MWTGRWQRQEGSLACGMAATGQTGGCPLKGVLPVLAQCQVWSWRDMRKAFMWLAWPVLVISPTTSASWSSYRGGPWTWSSDMEKLITPPIQSDLFSLKQGEDQDHSLWSCCELQRGQGGGAMGLERKPPCCQCHQTREPQAFRVWLQRREAASPHTVGKPVCTQGSLCHPCP